MSAETKIKKEALMHLSNNNWIIGIIITIITGFIPIINNSIDFILKQLFNLNSNSMSLFKYYLNDLSYPQLFYVNVANLWLYSISIAIITILVTILFMPLSVGSVYWAFKISNGEAVSIKEVFRYYSNTHLFLRAVYFKLNTFIRTISWSLLFIAPGFALLYVNINLKHRFFNLNYILSSFISFIAIAFIILGFIAWVFIVLKYFLASYYIVMNDDGSITNCIKASFLTVSKRRKHILKLFVSFIPWFLACVFVLPILYVSPYFNVSCATCAKWLIYEYNKGNN